MVIREMFKLTILAFLLSIAVAANNSQFKVIFQWNYIDYNWPSERQKEQAQEENNYIKVNNAIAGIKLWKDKMYLTIPRWKSGVPVTLAVTAATPIDDMTHPMLDPYPNWEMQTVDDCNALQLVQSMEIDPLGRMWILDTGRTETMSRKPPKCSPRLVILDLENEGAVLRSYVFPENVAPRDSTYLNDIVLDHEDGGMAFITDNGRFDPGIIVYSLNENKSWKFRHSSMKAEVEAIRLTVADITLHGPMNVNGIALSPPGPERQLYFSPVSSFHLYSVPVWVLKNSSIENIGDWVTRVGKKISQTDGMVMTNQGSLYLGFLADDAIAVWDQKTNPSFDIGVRTVIRDHSLVQWPDTFAIDEEGRLWCVTNALQNFISNHVDISRPNYRVIRSTIGAKNYQYFENGTAPELPVINGGANYSTISLLSLFISLTVSAMKLLI